MTEAAESEPDRRLPMVGPRKKAPSLSQAAKALIASVLLVVIGGFVAPSTVSWGAIITMLPFVATLAVASIGQHVVIQQRGVDLSVSGMMSLSAVTVSAFPSLTADLNETLAFIVLALAMGAVVGAINGVVITLVRVPALVMTIGMNALLMGATMVASRGFAQQVPPLLASFGVGKIGGLPNTLYVMVILGAIAAILIARTGLGRRFVAISVNPAAAIAVGIPIRRYQVAAYVLSGVFYAAGGIVLASYLVTPTVFCGVPYMLATIAAVVVGGNSIGGGTRGSVVATVVGAFFLTYLGQLVLSMGMGLAEQYIVQGFIVVCSAALPLMARWLRPLLPVRSGTAS